MSYMNEVNKLIDKGQLEFLPRRYDLKLQLDRENKILSYSKNPIIKFFIMKRYAQYNDIDCDKVDENQVSGVLYNKLWGINSHNKDLVDGDIMNSFWTTFKVILDLSFEKYYINRESSPICVPLLREYVLQRYALSKNFKSKFGFTLEQLKDYYSDEYNKEALLFPFIEELKGKTQKEVDLKAARFDWISKRFHIIRGVILDTAGENLVKELEEFARLTHTVGNLIITYKGYNSGRALKTGDYFDLTLESQKVVLGEDGFKSYVKRFFLEDYVDENYKVKPLWEGHSFKNKGIKSLDQAYAFLLNVNKAISNREKRILKILRGEDSDGLPNFNIFSLCE